MGLAKVLARLLRICGTLERGEIGRGVYSSKEDGLVLVHTSIGEKKSRVRVRDNRRGGDCPAVSCGLRRNRDPRGWPQGSHTKGVVPLLDKIVNESASDLDSIPLLLGGLGSHVESACCGE